MKIGIRAYGAYVPRLRIKRSEIAKSWKSAAPPGENAVPGMDEDVITMAVEASENALAHGDLDGEVIDAIYLASTSTPYESKQSSITIAEVLGCKKEIRTMDVKGSFRSSTQAFFSAMDFIEAGKGSNCLVVASDSPNAAPGSSMELNFGAGAAAFIVSENELISEIIERYSFSTEFQDTWRKSDERYMKDLEDPRLQSLYGYQRTIPEAVNGLLKRMGVGIENFDGFAVGEEDRGMLRSLKKILKIKKDLPSIFQSVGNAGSASVFLSLANLFDDAKPGEKILVASYGSGSGSDVFALVTTPEIDKKRERLKRVSDYINKAEYIEYTEYLRLKKVLWR
ncbi:MAG: hydroxymethylglutaryl-CoA synthase [Candidatus Syntropharchaeia archaeon]